MSKPLLLTGTLILVALCSWHANVSAQIQPPPGLPYDFGQWDGPYHHTEFALNDPPHAPATQEVVHLVVLPPPSGEPTVDRVLFWCRRKVVQAVRAPHREGAHPTAQARRPTAAPT